MKFKLTSFTYLILFLTIFSVENSFGQIIHDYRIYDQDFLRKSTRLLGNSVTDIRINDLNTMWIGTGKGLNSTSDNGGTFEEFTPDQIDIGFGGISALAVSGNTIVVATAFDDPDVDESNATGSGISISTDNGATWLHIDQPIDSADADFEIVFGDTIGALPITLEVDNVTFDAAILDDGTIYITSFAGGARRSTDLGMSWERVVLPPDSADSLTLTSDHNFDLSPVDNSNFNLSGNLNHRPFSVIAWGDTVYIGTAGGINRSTDGGLSWYKFNAATRGITGGWAVAMHRHFWKGKEVILAATRPNSPTELTGVTFSSDGGNSWNSVLPGERVWNFGSVDSVIYAAADSGLFKSIDGGLSWASFPPVHDLITGSPLYTSTFFSVRGAADGKLWAGTADGLIFTENNGVDWTLLRATAPVSSSGGVKSYSYPNPFSPARHNTIGGDGHVRFHYSVDQPSTVTIKIYDFSMTLVTEAVSGVPRSKREWDDVWNGKNDFGSIVANGTYFYKIIIDHDSGGSEIQWGKVMVIE